jgi:putative membrane protein
MVLKIIVHILISAVTILLIEKFVDGISVDTFITALVVSLLLGVLNVTVKPILFILTLPLTLITLGLFTFVLNALLFWFLGSVVDGFVVTGFIPAFLGALVLSIVSTVAHKFL